MPEFSFTAEEWSRVVGAYWESRTRTARPVRASLSSEQRRAEHMRQKRLLEEYAECLPFLPVSRCPFSLQVVEYVLDPFGLEGPWWSQRMSAAFPEPRAGDRFRVLLGAVDFHGRAPTEAKVHSTVIPGPGVPFVVPAMLELDTMVAVVSQVELGRGDTGYAIAYFSAEPVHGAHLHQPWARQSYVVLDEEGNELGWTISNARWDFDLAPWVATGKLLWIEPGDESLTLCREGTCPYLDLPGTRAPQLIERGVLCEAPLPDGTPLKPFE